MLFVAAVAAAILAVPRPADAWWCPETWNPAQQPSKFTGVPAGTSTAPGTQTNGPINPDGFYNLTNNGGGFFTLQNGCPGFGGVGNIGNGDGTNFIFPGDDSIYWPDNTTIKYTQAIGTKSTDDSETKVDVMAGNNGGGTGNATYIKYHLWGSGDLYVCQLTADLVPTGDCVCCPVPPPNPY